MQLRKIGNRIARAIVVETFLLFLILPFAFVFFLIALFTLPPNIAFASSVRGLIAFSGILWIALFLARRHYLRVESQSRDES